MTAATSVKEHHLSFPPRGCINDCVHQSIALTRLSVAEEPVTHAIALQPCRWERILRAGGSTWRLLLDHELISTRFQLIYWTSSVLLTADHRSDSLRCPSMFQPLGPSATPQRGGTSAMGPPHQHQQLDTNLFHWGNQSLKAHRGKAIKTNKNRNMKTLLNNT